MNWIICILNMGNEWEKMKPTKFKKTGIGMNHEG